MFIKRLYRILFNSRVVYVLPAVNPEDAVREYRLMFDVPISRYYGAEAL